MGIRGLEHFIHQRVPAAFTAVTAAPTVETWAIDCSCIMYRARAASLQPVTVLASLIVKLRGLRVEPLVIFDGRPPSAKAATIELRRAQRTIIQNEIIELTELDSSGNEAQITALQRKIPSVSASDKDAVKQLLYAAGVLFLNATGEADDLIAALYKRGDIQAVISTDMDMLPRGIQRLIIPKTSDASTLTCVRLDRILSTLSLTYDQFVAACVLMGSDYSERRMNPHQAVLAVSSSRLGIDLDSEACRQLKGDHVEWSSLLSPPQEEKRVTGSPPVEPDTLVTMTATYRWPPGWAAILQAKLTTAA